MSEKKVQEVRSSWWSTSRPLHKSPDPMEMPGSPVIRLTWDYYPPKSCVQDPSYPYFSMKVNFNVSWRGFGELWKEEFPCCYQTQGWRPGDFLLLWRRWWCWWWIATIYWAFSMCQGQCQALEQNITSFGFPLSGDNCPYLADEAEKAMEPHSSTLSWKIPWAEEPGGLQSMGSLRVRHHWATSLSLFLSCIGEGNGNPLQCSCLENPRDRGVWWAAVFGVTQSWTWLKWLSSSSWWGE